VRERSFLFSLLPFSYSRNSRDASLQAPARAGKACRMVFFRNSNQESGPSSCSSFPPFLQQRSPFMGFSIFHSDRGWFSFTGFEEESASLPLLPSSGADVEVYAFPPFPFSPVTKRRRLLEGQALLFFLFLHLGEFRTSFLFILRLKRGCRPLSEKRGEESLFPHFFSLPHPLGLHGFQSPHFLSSPFLPPRFGGRRLYAVPSLFLKGGRNFFPSFFSFPPFLSSWRKSPIFFRALDGRQVQGAFLRG